jgi:hypothetical protein
MFAFDATPLNISLLCTIPVLSLNTNKKNIKKWLDTNLITGIVDAEGSFMAIFRESKTG